MSAILFKEINLRIMLSPGLPNVGIPKPFWEPLQSKHDRIVNRTRPRGLASVHDASSRSLVKTEILCWRTGYFFQKSDIAERKGSKNCPFSKQRWKQGEDHSSALHSWESRSKPYLPNPVLGYQIGLVTDKNQRFSISERQKTY